MPQHKESFRSVIRKSPRLTFNRSDDVIYPFIEKRHRHFGASNITFVDDSSSDPPPSETTVITSAMNPLTDFDLVRRAIAALGDAQIATTTGAIPGTQVDCVASGRRSGIARVVRWDTQARYNTQFNLYKFKRLKMFRLLLEAEPRLHTLNIPDIVEATIRHHLHLALYGADEGSVEIENCPYCGSAAFAPLPGSASQPLIGYVSPEIPLYRLCESCGLGFMTPHVAIEQTAAIYDAYDFADSGLGVTAPHESALSTKQQSALDMATRHLGNSARVLDLGGGTGRFSYYAKRQHSGWHVVHSDFEARKQSFLAEYGIETRNINIARDEIGHNEFDLIAAFEVIEHLDFSTFVSMISKVQRALRPGGYLLFTTPDLDSPLVRAFDFFNAYAPHHLLLFSATWLRRFFSERSSGFDPVELATGGDLLDDAESYFRYYAETSPTSQLRASAEIIRSLAASDTNRHALLAQGYGSEVIMLLRRN